MRIKIEAIIEARLSDSVNSISDDTEEMFEDLNAQVQEFLDAYQWRDELGKRRPVEVINVDSFEVNPPTVHRL